VQLRDHEHKPMPGVEVRAGSLDHGALGRAPPVHAIASAAMRGSHLRGMGRVFVRVVVQSLCCIVVLCLACCAWQVGDIGPKVTMALGEVAADPPSQSGNLPVLASLLLPSADWLQRRRQRLRAVRLRARSPVQHAGQAPARTCARVVSVVSMGVRSPM
jgi:hypothetical protein